jgi:hypothetical protein
VPNDFQRITPFGVAERLKKCNVEILEILKEGSIFSTFSVIMNESLNHFASKNRVNYFIGAVVFLPLLFYQYLSLLLDKAVRSENVFCNYLILMRKK